MKKIILKTFALLAMVIIGYYVYAFIIAVSSQRMPMTEIPKKIKLLEKQIQKETNSGISTFFLEIPMHEIENCNAKLELSTLIANDSITKSKELIDNYLNSINKRVNEQLVNKECIDSLVIKVSIYYNKEGTDNLKQRKYRYSFPIK